MVELDPNNFERAQKLAEAQIRNGDLEAAGPHLAILAEGLAARGQHDDAINVAERGLAAKQDPKLARIAAQLYLDRGLPKDGAAAFVKIQLLYKHAPKDLDTLGLLARALYCQPRVLILDEGTANLDEATEELIADLVEKMPITRIVVAHRPALIRRATRVFRINERQIAEVDAPVNGDHRDVAVGSGPTLVSVG